MGDVIRSVRGYGCPPGFPDGWGLAPLETSFPGLPLFDGPNPLGAIRSSSSSRRSLSTFMGPILQRVVRQGVVRRRGSGPRRTPPAGAVFPGVVRVVVGRVVVPRVARAAGRDPLLQLLESQLEDPHDSTSTKGDVPSVRPVRPKYGEDRERRARTGDHPADHNPLLVGHLWEWRRAWDLRMCPELRHGRAVGCVSVRRGSGRRSWLERITPRRGWRGLRHGVAGADHATACLKGFTPRSGGSGLRQAGWGRRGADRRGELPGDAGRLADPRDRLPDLVVGRRSPGRDPDRGDPVEPSGHYDVLPGADRAGPERAPRPVRPRPGLDAPR